ncbi:MAG: killer suppression protein HigA [Candidatus Dadabacteria bacterium]|nr:killer suppression protein HigA [Candidatus Dadabacteria bacterium]
MDISFLDSDLKKLCEDSKYASRKLGSASARKLQTRLADLDAAAKLGDVTVGRPHPLKGDRIGEFALDLSGGRSLVFKSCDDPAPLNADGDMEWREVKSIRIVFIGDYHD